MFPILFAALAVVSAPLSLLGVQPIAATLVPTGLAWASCCIAKSNHATDRHTQERWTRLALLSFVAFVSAVFSL